MEETGDITTSPSILPKCLSILATQEEQVIPVTLTTAFLLPGPLSMMVTFPPVGEVFLKCT